MTGGAPLARRPARGAHDGPAAVSALKHGASEVDTHVVAVSSHPQLIERTRDAPRARRIVRWLLTVVSAYSDHVDGRSACRRGRLQRRAERDAVHRDALLDSEAYATDAFMQYGKTAPERGHRRERGASTSPKPRTTVRFDGMHRLRPMAAKRLRTYSASPTRPRRVGAAPAAHRARLTRPTYRWPVTGPGRASYFPRTMGAA